MNSNSFDVNNRRVDSLLGSRRPPLASAVASHDDLLALREQWASEEACPVFIEGREQGRDQSWGGLDIRTLLVGEESAGRFTAHSIVLSPGAGMPAHYHLEAHTHVLVLKGQVVLQVGQQQQAVGELSLGYAPPMTRIGMRNGSAEPVTLVIIYSPAGSDVGFAQARAHWLAHRTPVEAGAAGPYAALLEPYGFRFDDAALANDALTNTDRAPLEFNFVGHGDLEAVRKAFAERHAVPRLVATEPQEYELQIAGRSRGKALLTGDDSAGQSMLNLVSIDPGTVVNPHHQPTEEEFFFIAKGPVKMTCATETKVVHAGAMAFCPRNCTHAFASVMDNGTARFVTYNSPAGHERAMIAVRLLAQTGATPEALNELCIAGGFIFHGGFRLPAPSQKV